jgi:hypothetical protein
VSRAATLSPSDTTPAVDVGLEDGSELLGVLLAQINLILDAFDAEMDCLTCGTLVQVVHQFDDLFARHVYLQLDLGAPG